MFEIAIVADKKRITKKSFEQFLESQDRYFLDNPEKYNDAKLEEIVAVADYRRRNICDDKDRNKKMQINSITCQEAANMANVSKSTIAKWVSKNLFPYDIESFTCLPAFYYKKSIIPDWEGISIRCALNNYTE
jgi:SNF2 family DNA or RNA helicase